MLSLSPEFFTGAIRFTDNFDNQSRVVIPLNVNGSLVYAVVDTGAPFSVLAPDIAEDLGIDPRDGIDTNPLVTRFGKFKGKMCRIAVGLDSALEAGEGINLEVSFFIPLPGQGWPTDYHFVGLNTFLFTIRFAIDPHHNLFYFGKLV